MGKVSRWSDLEAFAEPCVAFGSQGDLEPVGDVRLGLLGEREKQRAAFLRSLDEARQEIEGDRYSGRTSQRPRWIRSSPMRRRIS